MTKDERLIAEHLRFVCPLIDSAGFLALWDASDEHHQRAVNLQATLLLEKRK